MKKSQPDQRSASRRARDEQIAAEPPLAAPQLPSPRLEPSPASAASPETLASTAASDMEDSGVPLASALAIAQHLAAHPRVEWVNYPLLPGNRYESLARRYLPRGAGGILTFGVKGGAAAGVRFIESVEFLSHLANVGDAKTLVIHPASTTHRQLDDDEQRAAGVMPEMVRLSVGLETLDDILWDIDQALEKTA